MQKSWLNSRSRAVILAFITGILAATPVISADADATSPRPKLQIINESDQTIELFWLKSATERVPNGLVSPGKDSIIKTTLGHRFEIVGRNDKFSATVTSEVPVQGFRFDPNGKDGVPAFYTQRVSASGFPIVASAKVNSYALKEAAFLVDMMFAKRPDVRAAMIKSGARMCIMAHNEYTTDLPEFARMADEKVDEFPGIPPKDYWDARARGLGGSETDPLCSVAEENVLGYAGDPYEKECILIHEFAHNIHLRGMLNVDPTFNTRLKATYDAAMKAGLWKGKYASVNHDEYFAEGVQSWFDNNRVNDHDHNHVHLRSQLIEYDPGLAAMCREVFGDTELKYTKPSTRLTGHMAGYDPAKAPTFVWPERLKQAKVEILAKAKARGESAPAGRKPNILHIHADDHRPDGLHALGTALLQTPNLDSLVARGMTFTHCYTMGSMSGAVCTPSRTMMLTGRSWQRIPGAPGAAPNAADPSTFLPRVMATAGYQTWHMGKEGNGFPAGLKQFETSIVDDAKGSTPDTDRAHCSQRLANRTIEFLKLRAASHEVRPFYIYLAPPVPHDPRSAEPQFHKLYDPSKIPLSPAFMPQHPFDNGEMSVRDEKLAPWPRTPADTKQQVANYYACITGLDHHVGRILAELKASGQLDNTIIVFSGDNGLSLGEHGLFGKQNLYEFGGLHVPLVVAGPGIPKGKSEAFVYLMDLFPTFAEFAGAKIPDGVEGHSIIPILTGKQTKVREILYTGYRACQRAIRDDRWKLIRYPLVDGTQLFDLSLDPHELSNLADKPEHKMKVAEMTELLQKEMTRHADTFPLTVANPTSAEWSPPVAGSEPRKKANKKAK